MPDNPRTPEAPTLQPAGPGKITWAGVFWKLLDRHTWEIVVLGGIAVVGLLILEYPEEDLPALVERLTSPTVWKIVAGILGLGWLITAWAFVFVRRVYRERIDEQATRIRELEEKLMGRRGSSRTRSRGKG